MGHICTCINKALDLNSCNLSQKQCLTNESKTDLSNIIKPTNQGYISNREDPRIYILSTISKCIKGFLFRKNRWFRLEGQLLQYQSNLYEAIEKKFTVYMPSDLPVYIKDGWKEYYKEIPFQMRKINPLFMDRIVFEYDDTISKQYDRPLMSIDELVDCALSVYKGSIDLLNNKQGEGVLISNAGSILKGNWVNNQFTGWNQMIQPIGCMYIGNFINGKIEGKGEIHTFNNDNGFIYRGEFVNGLREGQGIESSKGKTFVGEFNNDSKCKGKLVFDSGDVYEGEFENNSFNGKGHYTWKNSGHEYVGEYKNDKFNGEGIYRWNENDYYKGGYKDGLKQGQGELFMKNATVAWVGPFENGEMHGEGTYKCGSYNGPAEFFKGQLNKNYVPKKKNIFQKLYKKKSSIFDRKNKE